MKAFSGLHLSRSSCSKSTVILVALVCLISIHLHRAPPVVVFDEVYYGPVMDSYLCTQKSVMNNHPPSGKLFLAGVAKLAGYRCGLESWRMGEPYSQNALKVRIGSLISLILALASCWLITWLLSGTFTLAFITVLVLASDSLLVDSSSLLLLDSTLVAFSLIAIVAALTATRKEASPRLFGWALVAGVFCGLAIGTKWSGISALILCLGIFCTKSLVNRQTRRMQLLAGLLCFFGAAISYVGGWWLHFHLTSLPGDEAPLREISTSFTDYLIRIHHLYYRSHVVTGELSPHPSSSPWWLWPLGLKPIVLGRMNGEEILLHANRLLWIVELCTMLWLVFRLLATKSIACLNRLEAFGLAGWVVFYLPAIFATRWLFMYSYLPASVFALIGLVGTLGRVQKYYCRVV